VITPPAKTPGVNLLFYKALFHRSQFIGGWLRQEGFSERDGVTREIVDGFLYSARQRNAAYSALPFATGDLRYDFAPYLGRLTTPATVFWGAEETQVGSGVRDRLAALRPDIPLELIEGAKACPELERPNEVIDIVRRALDSQAPSS
jgi:pimeloyl-ACP methyl ester carboxylesterase